MKKWKTLRDNFVTYYRKQSQTKSEEPASKKKHYIYFGQLQFLLPVVSEGKVRGTNILPIANESEVVDDNQETNVANKEDAGKSSQGMASDQRNETVFPKKRNIKKPGGHKSTRKL